MFAHPAHSRARRAYGTVPTLKEMTTMTAEQREAAVAAMTPEERAATKTKAALTLAGLGLLLVAAPVQIFGINPWIVKAFKPEWSYGRRLAASFGVSFVAGTLISVAKGIGGVSKAGVTSTPAPSTAAATGAVVGKLAQPMVEQAMTVK